MKVQVMFRMLGVLALGAVLGACGGGGDAGPPAPAPASPYLGQWGQCNGAGRKDWLLVNAGTEDGQLLMEVETTFHAQADCSDSPGAYMIFSGASIVAEKTGQVDASLGTGANLRSVKADAFKTTTVAGTLRVLSSGMTVDYTRLNQAPGTWCINGVAGSQYCFQEDDEGLVEGQYQVAFLRENSQLYAFERDGQDGPYAYTTTFERQ